MAKPAMIIDLVAGPKHGADEPDGDEESPLDDGEDPQDAKREDPQALIASIQAQLDQLRRTFA